MAFITKKALPRRLLQFITRWRQRLKHQCRMATAAGSFVDAETNRQPAQLLPELNQAGSSTKAGTNIIVALVGSTYCDFAYQSTTKPPALQRRVHCQPHNTSRAQSSC